MKIRNGGDATRRTVLKLTGEGPASGASLAVSGTVIAQRDGGWSDRGIKAGNKHGNIPGVCGSTRAYVILVLIVALLTSGVGTAVAVDASTTQASAPDAANATEDGETRPANNSSAEYRPIEPSADDLDGPVDLQSAPEDLANRSVDTAGSMSSVVMDPSDNDGDHPQVGEQKFFLGLDRVGYHFKIFTLVAVENHIEVWVANDLSWPADDPRADPVITEAQAESMAEQFDKNMYPVESEVFGEPLPRAGTDGLAEQLGIVPDDYYRTDAESGNRTVLLVDNIRDENYDDPTYPIYIAGFYSPIIQQYTDRNVITVDSFDWSEVNQSNHLTGYEGTLAHEYQHLIHADLDGDETTWVNEGMSDYAEYLTGYGVSPSHLDAYQAMPSNSLVNWGDQGFINILADYGIANAFMMYLDDQYGVEFVSDLAHEEKNGIASVENTLSETGADRDFYDLFQDFSTAVVTDRLGKAKHDRYTFSNLDIAVNTSNGVETAGAWGADYRTVDTAENGPIAGVTVSGTDFVGIQWSTATDPVSGEGEVLHSGAGNLLDRHAIVGVDLSEAEDPTLTFDSYQRIEENWDYGFVQVSTDGGKTWESLANEHTDASADPNAHPRVKANLPGVTGNTDGWEPQTFDLSPYAGDNSVLVSFRYVTDWAVVEDGWYVRNVSIAGTAIPTDTTGPYESKREATGNYVEYQFTFVGVMSNGNYRVHQLDMRTFDEADQEELEQFLRNENFEEVVVVSTWAAEQGERGRVPVGVTFEFVEAAGGGDDNRRGPQEGEP